MLRIPAKGTCPEQIHLCPFSLVNLNLAFAKPIIIKLGVSFTKISRHPSHTDITSTTFLSTKGRTKNRFYRETKPSINIFFQPEGLPFEVGPAIVTAGAVSIFVTVWFGAKFPCKGRLRAVRASIKFSDSKTRKCGFFAWSTDGSAARGFLLPCSRIWNQYYVYIYHNCRRPYKVKLYYIS